MFAEREGWPADAGAMDQARRFLVEHAQDPRLALAPDRDVDGLCAGLLILRTLQRLGDASLVTVLPNKGEHVHAETMQRRLRAVNADGLVVLDMGSRSQTIVAGLPTLVIDHHRPTGFPPGAIVVNGHGRAPVAPTSLLAWHLVEPLVDVADLDWLMAMGTAGDLGVEGPFPHVRQTVRKYGRTHITRAVSLINAARRSPAYDVDTAFDVLLQAAEPADIALGRVAGTERLQQHQAAVQAELVRCARTPPLFAGRYALIRCASPAQIHPLLAVRWSRRLPDYVVIAANAGYLPGRVNFAMRNRGGVDMVSLLRQLSLGPVDGEFGFGHPGATGGSLAPHDFARLLALLGFAH